VFHLVRSEEGIMVRVRNWKTFALVALIGSLFGVGLLHWPTITIVMVALLFTGYTIVDEFLVLAAATRSAGLEQTTGDPAGRMAMVPALHSDVGVCVLVECSCRRPGSSGHIGQAA
jgi:hypothetical protein